MWAGTKGCSTCWVDWAGVGWGVVWRWSWLNIPRGHWQARPHCAVIMAPRPSPGFSWGLSSLQPTPQLLAPTHLVTSRTVLFRCVMTLPAAPDASVLLPTPSWGPWPRASLHPRREGLTWASLGPDTCFTATMLSKTARDRFLSLFYKKGS